MGRGGGKRAAVGAAAAPEAAVLPELPGSFLVQLVARLSPDARLAVRATCRCLRTAVDAAAASAGSSLSLVLRSRQPSLAALARHGLLAHVVVLDAAFASRGCPAVGDAPPWPLLCGGGAAALPCLTTARLHNSQASLAQLLVYAAPASLSRLELAVVSGTSGVVRLLQQLPRLASLRLQLDHPAWQRACTGLGDITQLQVRVGCLRARASRVGRSARVLHASPYRPYRLPSRNVLLLPSLLLARR